MSAPVAARKHDNPRGLRCWGVWRGSLLIGTGMDEATTRVLENALNNGEKK